MSGLKLNAEIALDGSGFQRGLAGIKNSLGNFKNQVAGAFGTFAIGSLVKGTIEWASHLQDSADALGVNVEFLQKLENGAKLAGAELGSVSKLILELNKSRQDALQNPNGKNAAAFGRMGISTGSIQSLSTQAFFEQVNNAFKNGATVQLSNDLQEVGGKSARNLIAAFANQFASDTPILAAAMIEQLDDIGDRFTVLKTTLMVSLAPAIVWVTEKIQDFIGILKQLGALAGGGAAKLDKRDGFNLMFGVVGWYDLFKKIFGSDEGGQAAEAEAQRQKAERQNFDTGRAASRAARNARNNAGMPFEQISLANPSARLSASDALLSVGNFLGSGSSLINSIATQQLVVAQKHLSTANQQTAQLDKIYTALAANSGGGFGGIEVPG